MLYLEKCTFIISFSPDKYIISGNINSFFIDFSNYNLLFWKNILYLWRFLQI